MISQGSFLWSEIVISGQEMYLSRESVMRSRLFVHVTGGGGGNHIPIECLCNIYFVRWGSLSMRAALYNIICHHKKKHIFPI